MSTNRPSPFWPILLPAAHYMSMAPLDVWVRLLFVPLASIEPRYWLRLYTLLFTSTAATIVTLPERLVMALWLMLAKWKPETFPGPVFVLGYYRSGTTHLHYLLECDPQLYTPKWVHVLVPQGFVVSWSFLRLFVIPFMSGSRPMDAMDVGPEYAAEDHFGVNNWCLASTLPGKSVLPRARPYYDRFNELVDVSPAELSRWRRYQLAFVRKLQFLAGDRRLLLKSPSHTAHVERLLELFAGTPGVKFIHITRHPDKVVRSNVWMHEVFQSIWNLQDVTPREELEDSLVEEYLRTEQSYLKARDKIPAGNLAEIRIQDLHADPVGEVKRVYRELNLEYTPAFEARLLEYLHATRDFTPNKHYEWTPERARAISDKLAPLVEKFRHHEPAIAKNPPPKPAGADTPVADREWMGGLAALAAAALCGAVWFWLSRMSPAAATFTDRMIWPSGLAVGFAAYQGSGRMGTKRLGWLAVALTVGLLLGIATWNTRANATETTELAQAGWSTAFQATLVDRLTAFRVWFWGSLGLVSAFRLGTRTA